MVKFVAVAVWLFMVLLSTGYGDIIVLRNGGANIDLKIISVRKEYINAILSRNYITSLSMEFSGTNGYADVIILNTTHTAMECKIKEVADDFVRLQIPVSAISSLTVSSPSGDHKEMTFPDNGGGRLKTGDAVVKESNTESLDEGGVESSVAEDVRKGGIRDGLRASSSGHETGEKNYRLRMKKPKGEGVPAESALTRSETASSGLRESVTDEITGEMETEAPDLSQEPVHEPDEPADKVREKESEEKAGKNKSIDQDPTLGRVEGRILHSGKPLPGCRVKLQMLEKVGLLSKGYRPVEGALEIEANANNEGVYHFMNVSPGMYKMYWQPPSETAWVRRFKMEPDVVVNSGKLTKPKDIETLKRTLN
ncbi:carboxypeptidase regulatory-like domain-containing protein [Candidatus Brocadia pituitae]|nr:carboxypeptidase regulatory-like domain-containing protein [Candidatus Brocadia pituitae]